MVLGKSPETPPPKPLAGRDIVCPHFPRGESFNGKRNAAGAAPTPLIQNVLPLPIRQGLFYWQPLKYPTRRRVGALMRGEFSFLEWW